MIVAKAVVDFEDGNPCGGGSSTVDKRRMTGGGNFASSAGNALRPVLQRRLTMATCSNNRHIDPGQPAANFDTYTGRGSSRLNGVAGATAEWTFTDAGEPGATTPSS